MTAATTRKKAPKKKTRTVKKNLSHLKNVPNITGLYGIIEKESACDLIREVQALSYDWNEEYGKISDLEITINSEGGAVSDMMAIYDVIKAAQKRMEISTHGVGSIMSAAVPVLACGSKGKRTAGPHCRFMLHNVSYQNVGKLNDLENDLEEVRKLKDIYIKIMVAETNMTKKQLTEIFSTNMDHYFDAKTALKYGIIDKIV